MKLLSKTNGFFLLILCFVVLVSFQNCGEINLQGTPSVESPSVDPLEEVSPQEDLNFAVTGILKTTRGKVSDNFVVLETQTPAFRIYFTKKPSSYFRLAILKNNQVICSRDVFVRPELAEDGFTKKLDGDNFETIVSMTEQLDSEVEGLGEVAVGPGCPLISGSGYKVEGKYFEDANFKTEVAQFTKDFTVLSPCEEIAQKDNSNQASLINPVGYQKYEIPWSEFVRMGTDTSAGIEGSVVHYFPQAPNKVPVGSWTLSPAKDKQSITSADFISMKGKFLSVPFVATGASESQYEESFSRKFEWIGSIALFNFPKYRPHPETGVFVTISTCGGDLRYSNDVSKNENDPTLTSRCRIFQGGSDGAQIHWGPKRGCQLTPGEKYYLNVVFADPRDGLDPNESTCDPGSGYPDGLTGAGVCDIMFLSR